METTGENSEVPPNCSEKAMAMCDREDQQPLVGHVWVRGKVAVSPATVEEGFVSLLQFVMKQLGELGIFRIHALLDEGNCRLQQILESLGFVRPLGEVTMIRELREAEQFPFDEQVRPMRAEDVDGVLELFAGDPEVALCDWEDASLLQRALGQPDSAMYVCRRDGRLAGAILAGSFGTEASICHTAVAPEFKGLGIGRALVNRVLYDFSYHRIRRVHLMVTPNNLEVVGFWRKLGFTPEHSLSVWEYDLPYEQQAEAV